MCGTPSARFWIVIRWQTLSSDLFANIGATKLRRLFCTARFRLRRCWRKKRRHFAARERPRHAIAFQDRQGGKPIITRQRCGKGGKNRVSHELLLNEKNCSDCQLTGGHPAADCTELFGY